MNEQLRQIGKIDERNKGPKKKSWDAILIDFGVFFGPFWSPNASRTRPQKGLIFWSKKGRQKNNLKASPGVIPVIDPPNVRPQTSSGG